MAIVKAGPSPGSDRVARESGSVGLPVCEDGGISGWRSRGSGHESRPRGQGACRQLRRLADDEDPLCKRKVGHRMAKIWDLGSGPICDRVPMVVGGPILGARDGVRGAWGWLSASEARHLVRRGAVRSRSGA